MDYYVYIIKNLKGKIYIGQTYNLKKRVEEHNTTGFGYTSKFRPWKLIHSEIFSTRQKAIIREKYLKTGAGRDWIKINIMGA